MGLYERILRSLLQMKFNSNKIENINLFCKLLKVQMIEIFDGLEINENFDGIKIQKTMNSRLIKTEQDNCHFDFKLVFSTGFANQYQVNPTIDYDGDIIFLVCAKIREKAIIICQMSLDLIIYTFLRLRLVLECQNRLSLFDSYTE